MNPRLTCRLVRTWAALRESSPSAHLAGCPDCQAYFTASQSLEAALRHNAATARAGGSANLERDILRAVRQAGRSPAVAPVASPSWQWRSLATAGAVAVALVIGSLVYRRSDPAVASGAAARAEAVALLNTAGTLSDRLAEEVIPTVGGAIAENPLQSELTAVYFDARAAVDFLALNFLPGSTTAADRPRTL